MLTRSTRILNYENIITSKYEYHDPEKVRVGVYHISISYLYTKTEKIPIYIETPRLTTITGIVKGDTGYYLDCILPMSGAFYQFIAINDDINISNIHENSRHWFGKAMTMEMVANYYKPSIQLRDGGKLPLLRLYCATVNNKSVVECYTHNKDVVDIDFIKPNDEICCIVEYSGLRLMSNQVIPEYEISKIKIYKSVQHQSIESGYIFSDREQNASVVEESNTMTQDNRTEVDTLLKKVMRERINKKLITHSIKVVDGCDIPKIEIAKCVGDIDRLGVELSGSDMIGLRDIEKDLELMYRDDENYLEENRGDEVISDVDSLEIDCSDLDELEKI